MDVDLSVEDKKQEIRRIEDKSRFFLAVFSFLWAVVIYFFLADQILSLELASKFRDVFVGDYNMLASFVVGFAFIYLLMVIIYFLLSFLYLGAGNWLFDRLPVEDSKDLLSKLYGEYWETLEKLILLSIIMPILLLVLYSVPEISEFFKHYFLYSSVFYVSMVYILFPSYFVTSFFYTKGKRIFSRDFFKSEIKDFYHFLGDLLTLIAGCITFVLLLAAPLPLVLTRGFFPVFYGIVLLIALFNAVKYANRLLGFLMYPTVNLKKLEIKYFVFSISFFLLLVVLMFSFLLL